MSKFKVGSVVEIVACARPENAGYIGAEAVVVAVGVKYREYDTDNWRNDGVQTFPNYGEGRCYRPEYLRLKRPPDEPKADFTAGEWELCPWRPKHIESADMRKLREFYERVHAK